METIFLTNSLQDASWLDYKPQVLVLGHFDGIHKGHAHVIERALAYGKQHHLPVSLMTFHPHPKGVFGRSGYDRFLTPLKEKQRLLSELGLDRMYVVNFDHQFANATAEQFVQAVCSLGAKHVVCGFDYRFGHKGSGTASYMQEWGKDCFTVDIVEPCNEEGLKVSSTRLRAYLAEGDIKLANQLLGRPYTISGEIVHGEKRGRTIGYPTANVQPEEPYFIPRLGVYAVKVEVRGITYDSVLSIGLKPTFHSNILEPIIEAHLFDFNEDIYGETMTIFFVEYIRPEAKFASIHELIEAINQDAEEARKILHPTSS
ncbi:bifunctional riboflavin kinase/FAD synthetase [Paenibacillus marinisediminis]